MTLDVRHQPGAAGARGRWEWVLGLVLGEVPHGTCAQGPGSLTWCWGGRGLSKSLASGPLMSPGMRDGQNEDSAGSVPGCVAQALAASGRCCSVVTERPPSSYPGPGGEGGPAHSCTLPTASLSVGLGVEGGELLAELREQSPYDPPSQAAPQFHGGEAVACPPAHTPLRQLLSHAGTWCWCPRTTVAKSHQPGGLEKRTHSLPALGD